MHVEVGEWESVSVGSGELSPAAAAPGDTVCCWSDAAYSAAASCLAARLAAVLVLDL